MDKDVPASHGPTDAPSPLRKPCVEAAEGCRKKVDARGDVREGGRMACADIAVGVMRDVKCRVAPKESGREVEKRQARQTVTRRPCPSPPLPRRLSLPHQRFCLVPSGHQLCSVLLASRAVQSARPRRAPRPRHHLSFKSPGPALAGSTSLYALKTVRYCT